MRGLNWDANGLSSQAMTRFRLRIQGQKAHNFQLIPTAARRLLLSALSSSSLSALLYAPGAQAQSANLINVCAGLGVQLPHLVAPTPVTSSFPLVSGLTSTLTGLVGDISQGIVAPLSDITLRVGVLDANGHLVSVNSPGNCNLSASSLTLDASKGLSIGGGHITGLGSPTEAAASAGDVSSIALGNGAVTAVGKVNALSLGSSASAAANQALALGLRSSVVADDGIALGARSTASASGAVALGSGSVATRSGLAGAIENFSGAGVASTQGAVSVGDAGAERQIVNVAGGTRPTDAVNLRQLSAAGNNLASGLGGGARFDATTGLFTAPSFAVQGSTYRDVGGALGALDLRLTSNTTALTSTAAGLQTLQDQVASLPDHVQQNAVSRTLTIGKGTDGAVISIAGSAGDRRLSGVGAAVDSNDAVNLGQLRGSGQSLAASLGGGAGFDAATGSYQAPSYSVGGNSYASVGGALGALDTLSVQYLWQQRRGNERDRSQQGRRTGGRRHPWPVTGIDRGQLDGRRQRRTALQHQSTGRVEHDRTRQPAQPGRRWGARSCRPGSDQPHPDRGGAHGWDTREPRRHPRCPSARRRRSGRGDGEFDRSGERIATPCREPGGRRQHLGDYSCAGPADVHSQQPHSLTEQFAGAGRLDRSLPHQRGGRPRGPSLRRSERGDRSDPAGRDQPRPLRRR
ncbi:hypothetical protein E4V01_24385 [Methylorubrum sp. Q1]|nr:hypothetical protein E4V01_24385 [Methylorubrum sp. Q1]